MFQGKYNSRLGQRKKDSKNVLLIIELKPTRANIK